MLDEILKVVPAGDLMSEELERAKLAIDYAISQFESGKNEGAAVAVGLAKKSLDELAAVFEKVYTK